MQDIGVTGLRQGGTPSQPVGLAKTPEGQGRRCRLRLPTVRCSTDSGHIAAPRRTDKMGQQRPFAALSVSGEVEYLLVSPEGTP
jgi:hypothetical protein